MIKENQVWSFTTVFTTCLLMQAVIPAICSPDSDAEHAYIKRLQYKFGHCYFPAQGWECSGGAAKVTLECDGRIDNIIVTKPLTNLFNKKDKRPIGKLCIIDSIKSASPVEAPPKTKRCPATLIINFYNRTKGGNCEVVIQ